MSRSDEYRANAAECQKMARIAVDSDEKRTWLEMAADWLRMNPKGEQSASDKFDDAVKMQDTHQDRSEGEH